MYHKVKSLFFLLFAVGLVGCSTVPEEAVNEENETNQSTSDAYDPLEGFNRAMWDVNYDYLDPYLVAQSPLLTSIIPLRLFAQVLLIS